MMTFLKFFVIGLLAVCWVHASVARETVAPTYTDVSYGAHPRNVLDFWRAEGEGPRPLLVYIHGGGWTTGNKSEGGPEKESYLDKGISVAAMNYRLTPKHPLPAPVHDAARAIQFLRSKAEEWGIDPARICLTGKSAGACTAMWLLYHDDLADPDAVDPVRRESTRVRAAAAEIGQTSIDPKQVREWLGPNVLKHRMIYKAVGEHSIEAVFENYDRYRAIYKEFSPYNHVTEEDPPLFMTYEGDMTLPSKNSNHGIHHPGFGLKMKQKADQLGVECHLLIGKGSEFKSKRYSGAEAFLLSKLLGGSAPACK